MSVSCLTYFPSGLVVKTLAEYTKVTCGHIIIVYIIISEQCCQPGRVKIYPSFKTRSSKFSIQKYQHLILIWCNFFLLQNVNCAYLMEFIYFYCYWLKLFLNFDCKGTHFALLLSFKPISSNGPILWRHKVTDTRVGVGLSIGMTPALQLE